MPDDMGYNYKWIFSAMMVMGLALSLAALFLLDSEVGIVGSCCWIGGWLLGAGLAAWIMND